jgi:DNA-binding response OmpR family regulator
MEKKRILVIDDEANLTKLLKINLELTGQYEVRTENNGLLGLPAAKEFKPDLVLLDIAMPNKDGYEIASGIRNNSGLESIPIIFMTGQELDDKGLQERVSKLGAYDYISKSCDFKDILAKIQETI